ncbi:hypothetical protein [Actinotalea sp. Marseille-Q4924]|uniref:hypothetical protein n=1 Tax=Actinotalea sp. Marseille-Q4924 TaxID=2866571 RepID=UPI001CE47350|nr:hypothetical protein [Actinotalea sp. Marseille-Q4924]
MPEKRTAPDLAALLAHGDAFREELRAAAPVHDHVADDLVGLADELDDILFRLAGLVTRRRQP